MSPRTALSSAVAALEQAGLGVQLFHRTTGVCRLLDDVKAGVWCASRGLDASSGGLAPYYPANRHVSAGLRAFVALSVSVGSSPVPPSITISVPWIDRGSR